MSVPLHRVFHGIKDLRLNECLRCETGVFSCVLGVSDDNPAKRKRTKPRNLLKYNDFARFLRDLAGAQTQNLQNRNLTLYSIELRGLNLFFSSTIRCICSLRHTLHSP